MNEFAVKACCRLVLVAVAFCANPASAALLHFEFTGTVRLLDSVTGDTQSNLAYLEAVGVTEGAAVTGSYTLDTSIPGTHPDDPTLAWYINPVPEITIQVGGLTAVIPAPQFGSNAIQVINNTNGPDKFALVNTLVPATPGFTSSTFELLLVDPTGVAFDDDSLDAALTPFSELGPYINSSADSTGLFMNLNFGGGNFVFVKAELHSHMQVVPLPAAAWLMLGGLAALGVIGKRR